MRKKFRVVRMTPTYGSLTRPTTSPGPRSCAGSVGTARTAWPAPCAVQSRGECGVVNCSTKAYRCPASVDVADHAKTIMSTRSRSGGLTPDCATNTEVLATGPTLMIVMTKQSRDHEAGARTPCHPDTPGATGFDRKLLDRRFAASGHETTQTRLAAHLADHEPATQADPPCGKSALQPLVPGGLATTPPNRDHPRGPAPDATIAWPARPSGGRCDPNPHSPPPGLPGAAASR